jgi:hypothetical protein
MGSLIRLRVALADRPGALAQVATIIAGYGGNITSVDVQRGDGQSAVDDLIVEFAGEPDLAGLRDDLATNRAATVLSHQAAQAVDPIVASFRRLVDIVDTGSGDPAAALAEGVAELCSSPVVWVSSLDEAATYEAGRLALDHHAPVAVHTTRLPEHLAWRLPGEVCLLAVLDPEPPGRERVVFVARPITNSFTATEIARIEALAALHVRIERLMARRNGTGPAPRLDE